MWIICCQNNEKVSLKHGDHPSAQVLVESCSRPEMFLEISQNSQENIRANVSFLITFQALVGSEAERIIHKFLVTFFNTKYA